MIQFYNTTIQKSTLHLVGNKTNDEGVKTSKKTLVLDLDETLVTSSCLEFPLADLKIKV